MNDITNMLSIMSIVLTIAGILGGIVAFRNGFARTANEIQERVINALETEIDNLRTRLDDVQAENARLKHTIETICAALKIRGMAVTIEGDMVFIRDIGGSSSASRIQEDQE